MVLFHLRSSCEFPASQSRYLRSLAWRSAPLVAHRLASRQVSALLARARGRTRQFAAAPLHYRDPLRSLRGRSRFVPTVANWRDHPKQFVRARIAVSTAIFRTAPLRCRNPLRQRKWQQHLRGSLPLRSVGSEKCPSSLRRPNLVRHFAVRLRAGRSSAPRHPCGRRLCAPPCRRRVRTLGAGAGAQSPAGHGRRQTATQLQSACRLPPHEPAPVWRRPRAGAASQTFVHGRNSAGQHPSAQWSIRRNSSSALSLEAGTR